MDVLRAFAFKTGFSQKAPHTSPINILKCVIDLFINWPLLEKISNANDVVDHWKEPQRE